MIGVALKGLLGRKLRTVLTALAIVLGVSMISGTYVLTDTITASFTKVVDGSYENADAVISGKVAFKNNDSNTADNAGVSGHRAREGEAAAGRRRRRGIDRRRGEADRPQRQGHLDQGGSSHRRQRRPQERCAVQPAEAHLGQLAGRQRPDRNRQEDIREEALRGRRHDRRRRRRGCPSVRDHGIATFASSSSIGASTIAIFDVPTAQDLFDKDGKFDEIQVAAKPGVTPEKLAAEIRPLLPETAKVKTAAAQTQEAVDDVNRASGIFQKFLLAFGFIALFVGAFVIANTLSITIAQRMREFATLRTIGGSRRQVLRSVMLEALVVGVMASLIGLFFGLAIAKGLNALFSALGVEFPEWRDGVRHAHDRRQPPGRGRRHPARQPPARDQGDARAADRRGPRGCEPAGLEAVALGPVISIVTLALGILLLVYGIFGSGLTTATRLVGARLRHADPLHRRRD